MCMCRWQRAAVQESSVGEVAVNETSKGECRLSRLSEILKVYGLNHKESFFRSVVVGLTAIQTAYDSQRRPWSLPRCSFVANPRSFARRGRFSRVQKVSHALCRTGSRTYGLFRQKCNPTVQCPLHPSQRQGRSQFPFRLVPRESRTYPFTGLPSIPPGKHRSCLGRITLPRNSSQQCRPLPNKFVRPFRPSFT